MTLDVRNRFAVCRASGSEGPGEERAVYLSGCPSLQFCVWTLNSSCWPAGQLHCSCIVKGQKAASLCFTLLLAGRSQDGNKVNKWNKWQKEARDVKQVGDMDQGTKLRKKVYVCSCRGNYLSLSGSLAYCL